MANIVNSLIINDPVKATLDIEKFFEERPLQDSEFLLIKYGFGRKVDILIGFDEEEPGDIEYYIEVWNNFGNDPGFELGEDSPITTRFFTKETSKEDRLLLLLDTLDDATKAIYKVVEDDDYEGGYTLK